MNGHYFCIVLILDYVGFDGNKKADEFAKRVVFWVMWIIINFLSGMESQYKEGCHVYVSKLMGTPKYLIL